MNTYRAFCQRVHVPRCNRMPCMHLLQALSTRARRAHSRWWYSPMSQSSWRSLPIETRWLCRASGVTSQLVAAYRFIRGEIILRYPFKHALSRNLAEQHNTLRYIYNYDTMHALALRALIVLIFSFLVLYFSASEGYRYHHVDAEHHRSAGEKNSSRMERQKYFFLYYAFDNRYIILC